jgi:RNA ligase (TIGR02306 family)
MEREASTFKVPLTRIIDVKPHPNADRLDICRVYDFEVITSKDRYKPGDLAIYIPVDSILPQNVENVLFPEGSKVKLHKHRVKQIKIRGTYSQGMLVDFEALTKIDNKFDEVFSYTYDGQDFAARLNITKYEPPAPSYQSNSGPTPRNKPKENPYFHKYGGLDNFKWYPDLFETGENVSVTEKIHGSHIRCGWAPVQADTLFKKVLKALRLLPSHEWVYGSNNVQLQHRTGWFGGYKGFYGTDVYGAALKKYGIKEKLKPGEMLHGELYGDGIQKNYNYGCKNGEHKLVWFDVRIQTTDSSDFLDVDAFYKFCSERGLDAVPELYRGPFDKELVKELTKGDSVFEPTQKVREGVVVKPLYETKCAIGRKVLKIISEKYLEGDNTDFH